MTKGHDPDLTKNILAQFERTDISWEDNISKIGKAGQLIIKDDKIIYFRTNGSYYGVYFSNEATGIYPEKGKISLYLDNISYQSSTKCWFEKDNRRLDIEQGLDWLRFEFPEAFSWYLFNLL